MEIHNLQELADALASGMVLAIDNGTVTSKVDVTTIEDHAAGTKTYSALGTRSKTLTGALNEINGNTPHFSSESTYASTLLASDSNINQIFLGDYYWSSASTRPASNIPDNNATRGRLWALDSGGGTYYCAQVCYTSNITWFIRYCTSRSNYTWTPWKPIRSTTWAQLSDVRVQTALTTYIDNLPLGRYTLYSSAGDATTVGAPTSSMYYYDISNYASSYAMVVATKVATGTPERYIKVKASGTWDAEWQSI